MRRGTGAKKPSKQRPLRRKADDGIKRESREALVKRVKERQPCVGEV